MFGEKKEIEVALLDIMAGISCITEGRGEEVEQQETVDQVFPSHDTLTERVRKSLYYGRSMPTSDRPSLPLTRLAVDQFAAVGGGRNGGGSGLGRLDIRRAADMARDACAGPTSLVLALIYLDRLKKTNPDYLATVSSADLFLVSMMVASKFLHDDGEADEVFNDEWATSGGLDVKEFNRLELGFLAAIDWRVNVSLGEFESALAAVEQRVALEAVAARSSRSGSTTTTYTGSTTATYTDLLVLCRGEVEEQLWSLVSLVSLRISTVCLASYAASLLTLVGTAALLQPTPLGPAAVAASFRVLAGTGSAAGKQQTAATNASRTTATTTTTSATTTGNATTAAGGGGEGDVVGEEGVEVRPGGGGGGVVSPADLLTASLLVASLTSSSSSDSDIPDLNFELDLNSDGSMDKNSSAFSFDQSMEHRRHDPSPPGGLGSSHHREAGGGDDHHLHHHHHHHLPRLLDPQHGSPLLGYNASWEEEEEGKQIHTIREYYTALLHSPDLSEFWKQLSQLYWNWAVDTSSSSSSSSSFSTSSTSSSSSSFPSLSDSWLMSNELELMGKGAMRCPMLRWGSTFSRQWVSHHHKSQLAILV